MIDDTIIERLAKGKLPSRSSALGVGVCDVRPAGRTVVAEPAATASCRRPWSIAANITPAAHHVSTQSGWPNRRRCDGG